MKTLFSAIALALTAILFSFTAEKQTDRHQLSAAYDQTDTIPRNKKDSSRYPRDTMRIPRDTINRDTNTAALYK